MARLEGIAKASYYPTPPPVVERVASLILLARHTPRRAVRLLDTCCGTGAALRQPSIRRTGENSVKWHVSLDCPPGALLYYTIVVP